MSQFSTFSIWLIQSLFIKLYYCFLLYFPRFFPGILIFCDCAFKDGSDFLFMQYIILFLILEKFLKPFAFFRIVLIREFVPSIMTWIFVVFKVINIVVLSMALIRSDTRAKGDVADRQWKQIIDQHFDDERMNKIYPKAIQK